MNLQPVWPAAGSLVWPNLLRAGGLALRPMRLVFALFLLVGFAALLRVPAIVNEEAATYADVFEVADDAFEDRLRAPLSWRTPEALAVYPRAIAAAFRGAPRWSLLLTLPALALWGVFGGAIARSAAAEFAGQRRLTWPQALGQSLSRGVSATLVTAGPLILVGMIVGLLAALGWLFLGIFALNYVGGALYIVAILLGAVAALTLLGLALGWPMLVPAVMCEGSDAMDAVGRVFAYVRARPLRLLLYWTILALLAALALWFVFLAVSWTTSIAGRASSLWLDGGYDDLIRLRGTTGGESWTTQDTRWQNHTGGMVGFWTRLTLLVVPAYLVSFAHTGGALLYLAMRRVCDGQSESDIWDPTRERPSPIPASASDEVDEADA